MSLKDLTKKIFAKFGIEIKKIKTEGQQDFRGKVFTLRSTMKQALGQLAALNFYPDIIIDVGTAEGTPPLLEVFPKAHFIFIEPLKEFDQKIGELLTTYSGKHIQAAAGNMEGHISINVHADKVGSSVYNETDGAAADGTARQVQIIKLNSLATQLQLPKKILLKIDVQGAELDVLNGANELLPFCEAILLEVSLFSFLVKAPDFYEIVFYMKQKGYVVYDLVEGHNRPLDFALAQKDILFVKENGQFRTSHRWATDEQRMLLKNENR